MSDPALSERARAGAVAAARLRPSSSPASPPPKPIKRRGSAGAITGLARLLRCSSRDEEEIRASLGDALPS